MEQLDENCEIMYIVQDDNRNEFQNEESDDSEKLVELLKQFNLIEIHEHLIAANITYKSLPYLSKEDLLAIQHTGLRAEFREKLFIWKKSFHNIDDETISMNSKVNSWLLRTDFRRNSSANTSSNNQGQSSNSSCRCTCVDVKNLLLASVRGKALLELYSTTKQLTNKDRDDIINIILETVSVAKITLSPSNFDDIVGQITLIFPTEVSWKDYYYVPREKKKNPRGRLYDKYRNTCSKKRKFEETSKVNSDELLTLHVIQDESDEVHHKSKLRRTIDNWKQTNNGFSYIIYKQI